MSAYFRKIKELRDVIKFHGGLRGSYWTIYLTDAFKIGTLKGQDKMGNRYYENKAYFLGRSRWVEFTHGVGTDYDASMVAPEWRMWLQYSQEHTPDDKPMPVRNWTIDNKDNKSGTNEAYVPYSTAQPRIQAWKPPS